MRGAITSRLAGEDVGGGGGVARGAFDDVDGASEDGCKADGGGVAGDSCAGIVSSGTTAMGAGSRFAAAAETAEMSAAGVPSSDA